MATNPVYLLQTCANPMVRNPDFTDHDLEAAGIRRIGVENTVEKSPELCLMLAMFCAMPEPQKALVRKNLHLLMRQGTPEAGVAFHLIGGPGEVADTAAVRLAGESN